MLNFVALGIMNYLIFGSFSFWRDPGRATFPVGKFVEDVLFLPRLVGRFHVGLIIAPAFAVIIWWALRYTKWGFEVMVTGDSPRAALYSGMRVDRKILSVLMVSGALAGLGGSLQIVGVDIPPDVLNVLPFFLTIVALMVISAPSCRTETPSRASRATGCG